MLVVIDMQPGFSAWRRCLPAVRQAIKKAKLRRERIAVVEYGYEGCNHGETLPSIRRLVEGYPLLTWVTKDSDGGGPAMREMGLVRPSRWRYHLVGVNTCACVRQTAMNLIGMGCEVEVMYHATACDWDPEDCRERTRQRIEAYKEKHRCRTSTRRGARS